MTESPEGREARRVVDDLEEDIVDVDKAAGESGEADDHAEEVPGSPEPPA